MEQRVYRWARQQETFTTKQVAAALKLNYWQAVQAVMRLCAKGSLDRLGDPPWHRTYKATEVEPDDLRGTAEGSLAALIAGMPARKIRIPTPKPVTALEQAWGYMPFSRVGDND